MLNWSAIIGELQQAGGDASGQPDPTPVRGGDISSAWRIGNLFVKTGPPASADMFSAEAEGLAELAGSGAVRVPELVACGVQGDTAYLATTWIEFGSTSGKVAAKLGEQLAALHATTAARFGWHRDNTIGLTPQINDWSDDWVGFFRRHRLGFQLRLAADKGFGGALQRDGQRLLQSLDRFFDDYTPQPALLHGDLWGGNWGACGGEPVIFDPAVYYGDRESDLAMTRLFGGFGREFYAAYEAAAPLAAGHRERCDLYQLYHVLNHLNLFGGGYLRQAQNLMQRLL